MRYYKLEFSSISKKFTKKFLITYLSVGILIRIKVFELEKKKMQNFFFGTKHEIHPIN